MRPNHGSGWGRGLGGGRRLACGHSPWCPASYWPRWVLGRSSDGCDFVFATRLHGGWYSERPPWAGGFSGQTSTLAFGPHDGGCCLSPGPQGFQGWPGPPGHPPPGAPRPRLPVQWGGGAALWGCTHSLLELRVTCVPRLVFGLPPPPAVRPSSSSQCCVCGCLWACVPGALPGHAMAHSAVSLELSDVLHGHGCFSPIANTVGRGAWWKTDHAKAETEGQHYLFYRELGAGGTNTETETRGGTAAPPGRRALCPHQTRPEPLLRPTGSRVGQGVGLGGGHRHRARKGGALRLTRLGHVTGGETEAQGGERTFPPGQ